MGSSLSLTGLVRCGSLFKLSLCDALSMGSSISVRSCARLGDGLSVCNYVRFGSSLSIRNKLR